MPAGQDQLAPSGPSARIDANLAALEILARLEADARPATGGEQAVLARWSGWGAAGVSDIFDERRDRFAAQRDRLRALLGEDGFAAARRTSLSAHYTDPEIDRAVWAAVTGLGFTGGRVLEPGCGAGTFIGTAPASVRIEATGIELDPATARVAAALYPSADIRAESFTDTLAPTGYFDLTIGNVPFADVRPHDPRFNQGRHALHNYFIIKSLHLTRPGGLVAVLTSHHTMDAVNPAARRDMNALADLVTAVRLPSGALRRSAGTEAVTDLLILRRREPGTEPASTGWEKTIPVELPGPGEEQRAETPINTWFTARPEDVRAATGRAVTGGVDIGRRTHPARYGQDGGRRRLASLVRGSRRAAACSARHGTGHRHDTGSVLGHHGCVHRFGRPGWRRHMAHGGE